MKILITGMSGTGKSSTIAALAARDRQAIDLDEDGWSRWMACEGDPTRANPGHDWLWDEERLAELLNSDHDGPLFVAGCAPNMVKFIAHFDHVVLLSAPTKVVLERIRNRSNNDYGKSFAQAFSVLENIRNIEPRLRRIATHELETTQPLDEVARSILRLGIQTNPGRTK